MTSGSPQVDGTQPGAKKKGLPTIAWIGIGCGVVIVIGLIVISALGIFVSKKMKDVAEDFDENPTKAAALLFVKMNPELDLVETDDDEGTITIREKDTGKIATFDFEEIKEGRFSFKTDEGEEVTIDADQSEDGGGTLTISGDDGEAQYGAGAGAEPIPDWVPLYPGSKPTANFSSSTSDSEGGVAGFATSDGVTAVLDYYERVLEGLGFEVGRQTFSGADGFTQGSVTGTRESPSRTVNIVAVKQEGETQVQLHYNEER